MGKPTRKGISQEKGTRRTETSKYPQEEKETSIPLVAASEPGTAQTRTLAFWGCRTFIT